MHTCASISFLRAEPSQVMTYRRTVLFFFFLIQFTVSFEESSLQRFIYNIFGETVELVGCTKQFCVLKLPISCCVSLIMVTITRQLFISVFQTEHFSALKFDMGYEKYKSFPVIQKSPNV